jgi:hypothetical protein
MINKVSGQGMMVMCKKTKQMHLSENDNTTSSYPKRKKKKETRNIGC